MGAFALASVLRLKICLFYMQVCFVAWLVLESSLVRAYVAPDIRFESVQVKQGVSLGYVDTIIQDQYGFIWMGGEMGLVRYDGFEFKVYRFDSEDANSLGGNTVLSIAEDSSGDLWIGTDGGGLNRYNRASDNFTRFLHDDMDPSSIQGNSVRRVIVDRSGRVIIGLTGFGVVIRDHDGSFTPLILAGSSEPLGGDFTWSLFEDQQGYLWVGSEGDGVTRYDPASGAFQTYNKSQKEPFNIADNTVRSVHQDREGYMWFGTDSGVYRIDLSGRVDRRWHIGGDEQHVLSSNVVWDVFQDRKGDIWVSTDGGGLNVIDLQSGQISVIKHDPQNSHSISSNVVREVIEDHNGDIWSANYPSGANIFHRSAENVKLIRAAGPEGETLSAASVLAFLEGQGQTLWIGTDGGGLNVMDLQSGQIDAYTQGSDPGALSSNAILSLARDPSGDIWVGTWGGGLNRFDPQAKTFERFIDLADEQAKPSHRNIWAVQIDERGDLWVGTEGTGINRYDAQQKVFVRYPHDVRLAAEDYGKKFFKGEKGWGLANGLVWSLFADGQGGVWIGTSGGLCKFDLRDESFTHYFPHPNIPGSPSDQHILSIYQDSQENLWLGTKGGANVFNEKNARFSHLGVRDGMSSDTVKSTIEDGQGNIWFGTTNGLVRYDPVTQRIQNYHQSNWGSGKFNNSASLSTRSGQYFFGSVTGVVALDPEELTSVAEPPPVHILGFELFNRLQKPGGSESVLDQAIWATNHITLTHKQSVFGIEYAAVSYVGAQNNNYAYKLDGFDDDWHFVGPERKATYTNLAAGYYRFQVIGANNEGVWNKQGKTLNITILPPPWLTWWAYCLYTFVLMLILGTYVYSQKRKIEQERAVSDRLRQLDRLKDDFLANTSHELRTPLNGIIGLSQSLIDGAAGEINDELKFNLNTIANCGRRLANLVNDILDFSRLKNKEIHLSKRVIDLRQLVDAVFTMSRPMVVDKDVDLSNNVDPTLSLVYADEDRLQQILFNLVGNAIKFTDQGSITVYAAQDEQAVWVSVADTGIGVDPALQKKIFESFEQAEEHESRVYGGTGLGLSVTKQLVEMHGGMIGVESDGVHGSVFRFSLPRQGIEQDYGAPAYADVSTEAIYDNALQPLRTSKTLFETNFAEFPEASKSADSGIVAKDYRILVVDDEATNRHMLANHLSLLGYQVENASSGSDALHMINSEKQFDLVLLDIMMPRMSGYEVCREIRKKFSVNELPVIFLTAKNMISDLIDGFEVGANDFLTKPIAKGELSSRVRTHLQLLSIGRRIEQQVDERTEEIKKVNSVLETLDSVVATLNREVIVEKLVEILMREASSLFDGVDRCLYWRYAPEKNSYTVAASKGYGTGLVSRLAFSADVLARYCGMEKEISTDVMSFKLKHEDTASKSYAGLPVPKAALIVPVHQDGLLLGCLMLQNAEDINAFQNIDHSLLMRFSTHAKAALVKARLMETLKRQNDQLESAALTDQQTGLRNKKYLHRCMDSDVAMSLRLHKRFSTQGELGENSDLVFFMVDIDGFDSINKTYGHSAGDRVLQKFKPLMETVFRQSDFLVRWGGDEFLMVARFCNRSAAAEMAERLREAVAQYEFVMPDGVRIHKTCSIGFAPFPFVPSDPLSYSWQQVIDIAGMCLSATKKSQKNAWLGLYPVPYHTDVLKYQEVISKPADLIKAHALEVKSSLESEESLKW